MRFVCGILLVFVLLAWHVENDAPATAYLRATMTPDTAPTSAPASPLPEAPGYPEPSALPYPAPHLTAASYRMFLPAVDR